MDKTNLEEVEDVLFLDSERFVMKSSTNNVDHPDHYNHGGIETIDVIAAWTHDLDGEEAFDIGNAIKYISRWKWKNGVEDLKKAVWYLNRVIELNKE